MIYEKFFTLHLLVGVETPTYKLTCEFMTFNEISKVVLSNSETIDLLLYFFVTFWDINICINKII